MRWFGLLGAALCCLLLASCSSSKPQDLIVGKWELIHDQGPPAITEEYTRDGKVIKYRGEDKFNERGYRFTDDQTIEFTDVGGGGPKATYKVSVTANEMVLTSGDNQVEKFKRVR
jgi:hypothetical protein